MNNFPVFLSFSPSPDLCSYELNICDPLDSVFTERIMGLPVENYKAYVEADATQRAKNIQTDTFFLIHGLADATAPYHHSIQLARALTNAGTIYRYIVSHFVIQWPADGEEKWIFLSFQSYADEGHDLRGVTEHVYRSMEHYYQDCLSLDDNSDAPMDVPVPSE